MGCCLCLPKSEAMQDPQILAHAEVIGGIKISGSQNQGTELKRGVLYVKNERLYYVPTYGETMPCSWCGESWKLTKVEAVEVVSGKLNMEYYGDGPSTTKTRQLNSWLRIKFQTSRRSLVLLLEVPDAVNFALQIQLYVSGQVTSTPVNIRTTTVKIRRQPRRTNSSTYNNITPVYSHPNC